MRKRIEWEWHQLDEFTWRAQVIGGWIVKCVLGAGSKQAGISITFVPDRDHEWSISDTIKNALQKEESAKKELAKDFSPSH